MMPKHFLALFQSTQSFHFLHGPSAQLSGLQRFWRPLKEKTPEVHSGVFLYCFCNVYNLKHYTADVRDYTPHGSKKVQFYEESVLIRHQFYDITS